MASIVGKNKNGAKQTAADTSAKEVTAKAEENVTKLKLAEDKESNDVLTHADLLGDALAKNQQFNADLRETVKSGEWNDYKSIAALRDLENVLTDDQFQWLPVPGSTKADALKARPKGSNMPLTWDVFDKQKPATTFYKRLLARTPVGKEAHDLLDAIAKDEAQSGINSDKCKWSVDERITLKKRAIKTIDRCLVALKQGAKIRIQIEKFKRAEKLRFEWIREEYKGSDKVLPHDDRTRLTVKGLGPVVMSTIPIRITDSRDERHRVSLSTFLNYKLDKAFAAIKAADLTFGQIQALSERKKPDNKKKQQQATEDRAARYKVVGITEFDASLNQDRAWLQGANTTEASERYKSVQARARDDDATLDTYTWIVETLRPIVEFPPHVERVKAYRDGLKKAGVS